ncbi:MAG: DUF1839 family protein [Burkholderiaceae bacterium]
MSSAPTVLASLNAANHCAHPLHAPERIWTEKNCYADLWVELLHALGLEPHASLPFVLALEFEGDQWTFFKPPLADLRALYGIDVQELNIWRPVLDHAVEHLGRGRLLSLEVDSFWLPDTAATDYRSQHTKTTIVLNALDVNGRRLGYFHNAGYFELEGEDFARLFHLDGEPPPEWLPPYAELIHIDRVQTRSDAELRRISSELLRTHLAWRPADNPITRFHARFDADLPALQSAGLARYHAWAFATLRQLGAAFELAALYLRWLHGGDLQTQADPDAGANAHPSIAAFELIALQAKTLLLKSARAVNSGRPVDAGALFGEMAQAWERGIAALES